MESQCHFDLQNCILRQEFLGEHLCHMLTVRSPLSPQDSCVLCDRPSWWEDSDCGGTETGLHGGRQLPVDEQGASGLTAVPCTFLLVLVAASLVQLGLQPETWPTVLLPIQCLFSFALLDWKSHELCRKWAKQSTRQVSEAGKAGSYYSRQGSHRLGF